MATPTGCSAEAPKWLRDHFTVDFDGDGNSWAVLFGADDVNRLLNALNEDEDRTIYGLGWWMAQWLGFAALQKSMAETLEDL